MTCNIIYHNKTEAQGDESLWRSVISTAKDLSGEDVYRALLLDADEVQAEWRDGSLWIYNGTINGLDEST